MKKSRQGSTSCLTHPEYMREQVLERTDREEIDAETLEQFNRRLDAVLNEELSNITETAEYQAELNALLSGSQLCGRFGGIDRFRLRHDDAFDV